MRWFRFGSVCIFFNLSLLTESMRLCYLAALAWAFVSNRCFTFENVLGSSLNSVKVSRFIFICKCATRKTSYALNDSKLSRSCNIETIGRFVSFGFDSVLLLPYARCACTVSSVLRLRAHVHRCVRISVCGNKEYERSLHIFLCWFCVLRVFEMPHV